MNQIRFGQVLAVSTTNFQETRDTASTLRAFAGERDLPLFIPPLREDIFDGEAGNRPGRFTAYIGEQHAARARSIEEKRQKLRQLKPLLDELKAASIEANKKMNPLVLAALEDEKQYEKNKQRCEEILAEETGVIWDRLVSALKELDVLSADDLAEVDQLMAKATEKAGHLDVMDFAAAAAMAEDSVSFKDWYSLQLDRDFKARVRLLVEKDKPFFADAETFAPALIAGLSTGDIKVNEAGDGLKGQSIISRGV